MQWRHLVRMHVHLFQSAMLIEYDTPACSDILRIEFSGLALCDKNVRFFVLYQYLSPVRSGRINWSSFLKLVNKCPHYCDLIFEIQEKVQMTSILPPLCIDHDKRRVPTKTLVPQVTTRVQNTSTCQRCSSSRAQLVEEWQSSRSYLHVTNMSRAPPWALVSTGNNFRNLFLHVHGPFESPCTINTWNLKILAI